MHSGQGAVGSLALLVVVLVTDAWVFVDARRRSQEGRTVVASVGSRDLETPNQWFVACLVLWVLFFPMYLLARSQ